jgi:hypothetical protein
MVPMFNVPSNTRMLGILTFIGLVGCQGPSVGTVFELHKPTLVILDKGDYEVYAELKAAGNDAEELFTGFIDSSTPRHKWTRLWDGSRVRVLNKVPDGVKVVVKRAIEFDGQASFVAKKSILKENARMQGTIGYIHLRDLRLR